MAERVKGAATMPSNPQFTPIEPGAMAPDKAPTAKAALQAQAEPRRPCSRWP